MLVNLDMSSVLYRQVYDKLRTSVLEGRFRPGDRLPSTRNLAEELKVSRTTVLLAYQELLAEGFIVGKVGAGTYVASELPEVPFGPLETQVRLVRQTRPSEPCLSSFGQRIQASFERTIASWPVRTPDIHYDFHFGQPALDWFPQEHWRRLISRSLRDPSIDLLGFAPPIGYPPLREAIAEYVSRARAVNCSPDQVIIVSGSQQAIDLIARMLLNPDDRVAIEEPHYHTARQIFLSAGAHLLPIPVDADGLLVSELERRGAGVRLLFTTPSHQFPTGAMMSLPRRLAMLQWARDANAYILEDDYNSEFRFAARPVPAIQGLDRDDRVIYVGTFSKALFPALRIGYIVAPPRLVKFFASAKFFATGYTPTLEQKVLADFIREGSFDRHLRRIRRLAERRKEVVLSSIQDHLGQRATVCGGNGGMHVVVWLRDVGRAEVPNLIQRALTKGVGLYAIDPYYLDPPDGGGLLLGYACMSERDIQEGIRILGTLL